MKRKLSIGEYNGLYARAEVVFHQLLEDFKFDCLKEFSQEEIYRIYKKNANEVVDKILQDLDIEVDAR